MIVVTGGSKGIGRAIVEKFASEGHTVATCGRNMDTLKALKTAIESQYGTALYIQTADLSVKEDVATFIDFVKRVGEPVEVLVNNTGVFLLGALHNEEEGLLETMIETNLYSAYRVTRGLVGEMMERKSGHIFNICSIASITAYANGGSYAISKHAMYGLSKCLRQEMKAHGVRVTSVMPGPTYTDSWAGVDLPQERFSTSEDVAELVYVTWKLSERSVVEDIVIRPQLGDL